MVNDIDNTVFKKLREIGLHSIKPDEWDSYYMEMAPWLTCGDQHIRAVCLERLCTAVFWSECRGDNDKWPPEPRSASHMTARTEWFINRIEAAHEAHNDIIPELLSIMVYKYPNDEAAEVISTWLRSLLRDPPANVSKDRGLGALILHTDEKSDPANQINYCISLLDDGSEFVRGCAAMRLAELETEQAGLSELQMFELIKEKEIQRPGVAGPFWSGRDCFEKAPLDIAIWMMEMLEQRPYAPEFDDIPGNDIEFHLHEICDYLPDMVRRMISGGFLELAIETATEESSRVEGMEPVLMILGTQENQQISWRAWNHLCEFYRIAHPSAPLNILKHIKNWRGQAEAFALCLRDNNTWTEILTLYSLDVAKPFSDDGAWELINSVLPPDVRGPLQYSFTGDKSKPPEPLTLSMYNDVGQLRYTFKNQTVVELEGDTDKKRWTRIHLWSSRLGFFGEEEVE